jgi:hypothetical protein
MSKSIYDQIIDPNEIVELSAGWGTALMAMALIPITAYLFWRCAEDSNGLSFELIMAVISVVWMSSLLYRTLKFSRWSPLYVGPTLTLTNSEIIGRGSLAYEKWRISWNDVERIEWRSNIRTSGPLLIYRKGMKTWEEPYCQYGPFPIFGIELAPLLCLRLLAYNKKIKSQHDISLGDVPSAA